MLQHEIFFENENQAMKKLMMGLTGGNTTQDKQEGVNKFKNHPKEDFKIEDLQSNNNNNKRESRWGAKDSNVEKDEDA